MKKKIHISEYARLITEYQDELIHVNMELDIFVADNTDKLISITQQSIIVLGDELLELKEEMKKIKAALYNKKQYTKDKIITLNDNIEHYTQQIKKYNDVIITDDHSMMCPILGTKFIPDEMVKCKGGYYYSITGLALLFNNGTSIKCPITQAKLTRNDFTTSGKSKTTSIWGSKLQQLFIDITEILAADQNNRIIIFSQWDSMLQLIGYFLKINYVNFVKCAGNISVISKVIRQFKTDNITRIMLLSSINSSSGNNLTEASHVFLIDTIAANADHTKAIETQAIARTVRLGQKRNVCVYRYIMKNTIEEQYYIKNKK